MWQYFYLCYWVHIQGDSGGICNTLGNDSICDSKQKSSYEHGSDFERLPRYGIKEDTDHPANTNSSYVINNITTNITCMQVLTIVLLMICNGQNPGLSMSGTSHNKFSKMPPPTSMHLWTRCRVLRVARCSSWLRSFIWTQALLMRATRSARVSILVGYTSPFSHPP